MSKDRKESNLHSRKIANDNGTDPAKKIELHCLFPEQLGVLSGEAELIARYLGLKITNDNEKE